LLATSRAGGFCIEAVLLTTSRAAGFCIEAVACNVKSWRLLHRGFCIGRLLHKRAFVERLESWRL
jgi:hypothetical protein